MSATNAGRSRHNIMRRAAIFRDNGRWPPWRWSELKPPQSVGWLSEVSRHAENGVFAALIRDIDAPTIGKVTHVAITIVGNATDLTWTERQRIKNELFGRERVAVEVMPPESELVDGANMYHMWVMPAGYVMPFSLATRGGIDP